MGIMSSNLFNFIAVSFLVYGFCKKVLLVNMRSEIIIVAYLSQSFCSTFFLLIKDLSSLTKKNVGKMRMTLLITVSVSMLFY